MNKYTTLLLAFPVLFSGILISCSRGEDLFFQAILFAGTEKLEKLAETVEAKQSPWDREAFLLMDSYPSRDWALKQALRIYGRGDHQKDLLMTCRRLLLLEQKKRKLQSFMEDNALLEAHGLYRLLLVDQPLNPDQIIQMGDEDLWELERLYQQGLELQGAPLMVLDYRISLLQRQYGQAQTLYGQLMESFPLIAADSQLLYWGWYGLAMQQDWEDQCQAMELYGKKNSKAAFALGRVYRYHGQFEKALTWFETAGPGDRNLWYTLDCAFDIDPSRGLEMLIDRLPDMEDPGYFDDKLEDALSELVRRRQWQRVEQISYILREKGEKTISARYFWVTARLIKGGYLSNGILDEEQWYREAVERDPLQWYGLLSSICLGNSTPVALAEFRQKPLLENLGQKQDHLTDNADFIILKLFEENLDHQVLPYLEERGGDISIRSLPLIEQLLLDQNRYYEAIHLALNSRNWSGFQLNRKHLEYIYPYAYAREVRIWSQEYLINPWLMHGLIRIESAYDPSIVSRSGAVGLGQLMEATAEEQARYLGMDNADLTDPSTNLQISARYIRWLMGRSYVENWGDMLLAYNGGPGSLQNWKRSWGDLPAEIFWESVPYSQSRDYLPMVFTSALIYGYLYGEISPEELLNQWVPELFL